MSKTHHLEPGLHSSITDVVETVSTLFKDEHKNRGGCITIK